MGNLTAYGTPGSPFGFIASVYALIYVVVGGEASFIGPIIGAVLLTMIPEIARELKEFMPLIFGGLLIFAVFFMPNGIVGLGAPLSRLYTKTVWYLKGKPGKT
jgi:branched-chain amino acid transport system permease protein